jgi:hypothetical protein
MSFQAIVCGDGKSLRAEWGAMGSRIKLGREIDEA